MARLESGSVNSLLPSEVWISTIFSLVKYCSSLDFSSYVSWCIVIDDPCEWHGDYSRCQLISYALCGLSYAAHPQLSDSFHTTFLAFGVLFRSTWGLSLRSSSKLWCQLCLFRRFEFWGLILLLAMCYPEMKGLAVEQHATNQIDHLAMV